MRDYVFPRRVWLWSGLITSGKVGEISRRFETGYGLGRAFAIVAVTRVAAAPKDTLTVLGIWRSRVPEGLRHERSRGQKKEMPSKRKPRHFLMRLSLPKLHSWTVSIESASEPKYVERVPLYHSWRREHQGSEHREWQSERNRPSRVHQDV